MNNQTERFHRENIELINKLIDNFEFILKRLTNGEGLENDEKVNTIALLDSYREKVKKFKVSKTLAVEKLNNVVFSKFDEKAVATEIAKQEKCINLLFQLYREKIMLTTDRQFQKEMGRWLIEEKYFEEIHILENDSNYYILSEKGENAINNKYVQKMMLTKSPMAVAPKDMTWKFSEWSDLYLKRITLIGSYFKQYRNNAEYILFSLGDSKEMVFGCEIEDNSEINYVFAGVFETNIEKQLCQLTGIGNSGLIDELIILIKQEEKDFLISKGLNESLSSKITYVIIQ